MSCSLYYFASGSVKLNLQIVIIGFIEFNVYDRFKFAIVYLISAGIPELYEAHEAHITNTGNQYNYWGEFRIMGYI